MSVPISSNPTDTHRIICRTIDEWLDLYGMSPPKPNRVRAFDKVPPTLQPLADDPHRCLFERQCQGYNDRASQSIDSVAKVIQSHNMHEIQSLEVSEN
ncbi:hypothetical protein HETIRDRAFT_412062 [Heterobasidion irregulare TC 32-1]|uniref:Uncharacterized protein n=1 Tax=Heterobasidion irregulare (strain TC 32-1) TaxID=747525 RepID=W4JTP0_HETIT|nr:uncharacterized protein HETIRDRAFT_412062 [Heterobasidion irregulare TC 32-1]ETW76927.1 hypothetical protein HETIRDRAFT_412062 [Heterobasidion irregulare TC 32-1]